MPAEHHVGKTIREGNIGNQAIHGIEVGQPSLTRPRPHIVTQVLNRFNRKDRRRTRCTQRRARSDESQPSRARADIEHRLAGEIHQIREFAIIPTREGLRVITRRVHSVNHQILKRLQNRHFGFSQTHCSFRRQFESEQFIHPGGNFRAFVTQVPCDTRIGLQRQCPRLFGESPTRKPTQLHPLQQQQRIERKRGHIHPVQGHTDYLFTFLDLGLRARLRMKTATNATAMMAPRTFNTQLSKLVPISHACAVARRKAR
ncbi:MAG: hypothetical protein BWY63_00079 [Chloroflexi bacterium ADurb.Bin360]|nr:MAG: hypothetical protein BWY63_00079 [Chloroflexi bacterium ADurb.Bin360]